MFFKKYIPIDKISFNCPKKITDKIDEISNFYCCSRTEVLKMAIEHFHKSFKRKISKLEKEE